MTRITLTNEDLKSVIPDTHSSVSVPGLSESIEIFRDHYGIPHVRTRTTEDAFFAQGFVTAQDRLWHMEFDRRRAYGRWAELAGPTGLEQDIMVRRFRLGPSAYTDYDAISPKTRAMLDSYATGVNAFIESTKTLPIEYKILGASPEPWQPWDSLAIFKFRHVLMGVFESKVWRARLVNYLGPEQAARLFTGYQSGQPLIIPPGVDYVQAHDDALQQLAKGADAINWLKETDAGSNSWVLAGTRTASKKPLLAGDPHRALDTPNVYYQNHISCPDFDVVGLSFPGVPGFPHFGHNRHVAWCVTHTGADYQDLFIEKFKENDPSQYKFKGQWLEAQIHHETIHVRDAQPLGLDVTVTHHGPIIAGDPGKGHGLAFSYTATAGSNIGADALLTMLEAKSSDQLEEAMRRWVDPCNNLLFADIQGNIGYRTRGQLPVRSRSNAWLPVPGWTGEHEWNGMVPFEEMPRIGNPKTGYIVTANNRVTADSYSHYIALEYAPGFRAQRVRERLQSLQEATVEDMAAIHRESTSIPGLAFTRLIADVVPRDEASSRAMQLLMKWNGVISKDSVEPTIYNAFRDRLLRLVIEPLLGPLGQEAFDGMGRGSPVHLGRLKSRLHGIIEEDDVSFLPEGSDWPSLMSQALSDAVIELQQRYGKDMDKWRWGQVHRTNPQHILSLLYPDLASLLNPPSFPMSGDSDTPLAASYALAQPYTVMGLSVARYVFDLSDWDKSRWVIPLGASGHPGSTHYADQAPIWADVQLVPMLYDWQRIMGNAESRQQLSPM